jgi:hypothetical protein
MGNDDWKDCLRAAFESIGILETCKHETTENFKQFCEFIAEPAFEALGEELKVYGVRSKYWAARGRSICLRLSSRGSHLQSFDYMISLPRNAIEMRLRLSLRARKTPKGPLKEKEEDFMASVPPDRVMKITREDLIADIIERYKDLTLEILTSAQ